MQRSLPCSRRPPSSVPFLFIFHRDHSSQLSLGNATPYRKASTASREANSSLTQPLSPFQNRRQHPLAAACPFCPGAWVCSGCLVRSGPPLKPCLSLFPEPPGGSNCQSLQPPGCLDCQGKGFSAETEISCFALVSPLSKVSVWSWTRWQYDFSGKGNFLYCGQHRIDAIVREWYTEEIWGSRAVWIQRIFFLLEIFASTVSVVSAHYPVSWVQFWRCRGLSMFLLIENVMVLEEPSVDISFKSARPNNILCR